MIHALNLPTHHYGYVAKSFLTGGAEEGVEPAIWFGLTIEPTQAPLLTTLLECGAIYRQLPPSAWSFTQEPKPWTLEQSTRYNSLGREGVVIEYTTLRDLRTQVIPEKWVGSYLFSLEFYGDAYSRCPEQSKTFHALRLENARLTFQPGHRVLFYDPSFTREARMPPTWLRRQRETWTVDEPEEP